MAGANAADEFIVTREIIPLKMVVSWDQITNRTPRVGKPVAALTVSG